MPIMKPDTSTQDENIITFKRSTFYAMMLPLAFAAGLLVGYLAWGRSSAPARTTAAQPPAEIENAVPAPTQAVKRYDIPTDGFPSLGPKDAPIVIVEFSDYQCPYCTRWHDEVYESLMAAYPDKIRLVYRNLPLGFHEEAQPAAEAAMCAGDQNSYWQYHGLLFGELPLGQETYLQYATDLGLDMETFKKCITENKYADFVQKDAAFAQQLGVTGTPTFFVNGIPVVGAQPFDYFQNLIDKELAGEIP